LRSPLIVSMPSCSEISIVFLPHSGTFDHGHEERVQRRVIINPLLQVEYVNPSAERQRHKRDKKALLRPLVVPHCKAKAAHINPTLCFAPMIVAIASVCAEG
jgi:hypothetical protein